MGFWLRILLWSVVGMVGLWLALRAIWIVGPSRLVLLGLAVAVIYSVVLAIRQRLDDPYRRLLEDADVRRRSDRLDAMPQGLTEEERELRARPRLGMLRQQEEWRRRMLAQLPADEAMRVEEAWRKWEEQPPS